MFDQQQRLAGKTSLGKRFLTRALVGYVCLLPTLAAPPAASAQPRGQLAEAPQRAAQPDYGPRQDMSFEVSGTAQSFVAENGFEAISMAGEYRRGEEKHRGGVLEIHSPWGEQLTTRFWRTDRGLMLELAETLFHFEQGLYGPATGLTVVTPDGFEHRAALGARVEALKTGTAEITADDFAITEALIAALGGYSPEFRSGFDALLSGNHAIETNCFTQSLLCIGALVTFLGSSLSVLGACSLTGPLTLACVAAVLAATGLSITSVAACAIWVDDCGGPEEEVQCPDTTPPPCHSPIIIDLDRNNFQLTGVADPVFFDIDADGTKDELCWTDGTQLDGFLALDRDGNDTIDDGGELFGNHTLLISGEKAPNGYVALAEFDQLSEGGNEDEVIDHLDAIFPKLRIWIDANHDGVSQPSELTSLAEAGVKRLDVTYTESQRLDAHGNALRYLSKAWVEGAGNSEKPVKTSDVFFVLAE